jgi:hypothetical protein
VAERTSKLLEMQLAGQCRVAADLSVYTVVCVEVGSATVQLAIAQVRSKVKPQKQG